MRRATVFATLLLSLTVVGFGILMALAPGMPWAFNTSSASPNGSLSCSVKASCAASEVEVLRMSSTSNAHAGTPGGSSYGNRVCCTKLSGVGTQCSGNYDVVLTLSSAGNAHVASAGGYASQVCLSGGDDATVDCTPAGTCPTDYVCLATISGSTNAHVADCNGVDDYATRVCCLATPDNCPTAPNPGQTNTDSDLEAGGASVVGDEDGDACDDDDDNDEFDDPVEAYVGTDPLDNCPDDPSDDAWPLDINMDTYVTIVPDVLSFRGRINTTGGPPPDPMWMQRLDLNADNFITIVPDILYYRGHINEGCT